MTPYELAQRWFAKLKPHFGEGKTTTELTRVYYGHSPTPSEVVFANTILLELEREGLIKPIFRIGQIWVLTDRGASQ